jgi:MFS family permease
MRLLYGAMLSANLISAVVLGRFLREPPRGVGVHLRLMDLPRVLFDTYAGVPAMLRGMPRALRALSGVIVLSFMANAVASPFWVVYAVERSGLSLVEWGLVLLVESGLKLVAFLPAGLLVDRWGRTSSLLAALLLSLVATPLFVLTAGFAAVLLVRVLMALAFTIAIPACTALMADLVPRPTRGRVMAAVGQGGIMLGSTGGGTGGPAVGYLITLPMILSALAGGLFFERHPAYPWLFVVLTTALSVALTVRWVRDPRDIEL